MPARTLRLCSRCQLNLVASGLCDVCRAKQERMRGTAAERGYNDARHLAWRRKVLAKTNGLCAAHLALGKPVIGPVADHIVPRENGGAQYDVENGQALCEDCHNVKRSAESRGRQLRVIEGKGQMDVGSLPVRGAA